MAADGPSRRAERTGEYARALAENERYAEVFDRSRLGPAPISGLAIVACMDARIDVEELLGLRVGDAHLIRNAGGLATEDVVRSLVVSQTLLGTNEIVLIQHTNCGLLGANEAAIRDRVRSRTGHDTQLVFGAFPDLESNVRAQVDVLRSHPDIARVPVHGLIFDVATGRLHEVA